MGQPSSEASFGRNWEWDEKLLDGQKLPMLERLPKSLFAWVIIGQS